MKTLPSSAARTRGFTILELLLVISIMVILIGVGSWGMFGQVGAQRLQTSALQLAGDIAYANQYAVKSNRPVTVRFYQFKDNDMVDSNDSFRAYQMLVTNQKTGKLEPLGKLTRLEKGTVFLNTIQHSSVLTKLGSPAVNGANDPDLKIGTYKYVGFQIRPDGTTTLGKMATDLWSLTLISEKPGAAPTTLPDDYRTVVINAATSATRVY